MNERIRFLRIVTALLVLFVVCLLGPSPAWAGPPATLDCGALDCVEVLPGAARFEFERRALERGREIRGQLGAAKSQQGRQGKNRNRGGSHGGAPFSLWRVRKIAAPL